METKKVENRQPVAIVTGSSRGIGRAIAIQLAKSGYNIMINYKESQVTAESLASELKQTGTDCLVCRADVSVWNDVLRMRDQVLGRWGWIDLLVNNAGIVADGPMRCAGLAT